MAQSNNHPNRSERQAAQNDASGHCIHCGRGNRGHEGEPCHEDCPQYWEARGIAHPDFPNEAIAKSDGELAEQYGTDERDEADSAMEEADRAAGR